MRHTPRVSSLSMQERSDSPANAEQARLALIIPCRCLPSPRTVFETDRSSLPRSLSTLRDAAPAVLCLLKVVQISASVGQRQTQPVDFAIARAVILSPISGNDSQNRSWVFLRSNSAKLVGTWRNVGQSKLVLRGSAPSSRTVAGFARRTAPNPFFANPAIERRRLDASGGEPLLSVHPIGG